MRGDHRKRSLANKDGRAPNNAGSAVRIGGKWNARRNRHCGNVHMAAVQEMPDPQPEEQTRLRELQVVVTERMNRSQGK